MKAAYVDRRINSSTGRMAKHYRCAGCDGIFPMSRVVVDHIEAVVDPQTGFVSWDEYIKRMFCSVEGLQVLCNGEASSCHFQKSLAENEVRKAKRKKK